jgi:predicted RNA binding protein YcfA (HicA-like mRNA interferase family)
MQIMDVIDEEYDSYQVVPDHPHEDSYHVVPDHPQEDSYQVVPDNPQEVAQGGLYNNYT